MNANQAGNTPVAKAHAAAVSAALSAAAVYGEWAPLAPLMRSGMLDACAHFLSSPEFRSQACEVLRHVAHRRRGDTVNSAIASGAAGVAGGKGLADHAALAAAGVGADDEAAREAAADAAAVISGLEGMCRGLGIAAQQVLASPPVDIGSEEAEYARRLTETIATVATNHLAVVSDESLRRAFLEALLGLTKYPRLCVLAAAIPAWPGLLRAMGAELPGTFVRPDKSLGSGVWGVQAQGGGGVASGSDANKSGMLPDGAVVALLECTRTWLQRGGGLASGLHTTRAPECKGDEWEEEYETRDELREAWIGLRARLMEVAKLCTALEPVASASAMAESVTAVLGWVQPGGPLDPSKAAMGPDGRSAIDDAIGSALEGCVSFVEPAMHAVPLTSNPVVANAAAPALEGMLTRMLAVEFTSPVAVSQMSRLLESMGRTALVRPDAGAALLHRLFAILAGLPTDDVKSPPARAKAAMMAGRTSQAARQRVCAAILGVCAAAPEVRTHAITVFTARPACPGPQPGLPPRAAAPDEILFFPVSPFFIAPDMNGVDLKRRRGTHTPSGLCYDAIANTLAPRLDPGQLRRQSSARRSIPGANKQTSQRILCQIPQSPSALTFSPSLRLTPHRFSTRILRRSLTRWTLSAPTAVSAARNVAPSRRLYSPSPARRARLGSARFSGGCWNLSSAGGSPRPGRSRPTCYTSRPCASSRKGRVRAGERV